MDIKDLRDFLPLRIAMAKTDMVNLSKASGLGETAVRDILTGKSSRPRYATLFAIATVLGCSVEDLFVDPMPRSEPEEAPFLPHPGAVDLAPVGGIQITSRHMPGARDLPVLGQAKTGYRGIFMDNGDILAWAERPPNLAGIRNAFAVIVRGDSMEPRYFDGEFLHINPLKPIRPGTFVLIELNNREAFVKRFVKRDDDMVTVEQYNPPARLEYPTAQVRHIYRVVGTADE